MKNKKLLIIIVVVIVIFIIAGVLYNKYGKVVDQTITIDPSKVEKLEESLSPEQNTSESVQTADNQNNSNSSNTNEEEEQQKIMFPDIPVWTLADEEVKLYDYFKEKPVVLNLFASWCPPCKAELPEFFEVMEERTDVDFVFLNAFDGYRENMNTITNFVEKSFPANSTIVLDKAQLSSQILGNSIPVTVLINSDGSVYTGFLGQINKEALIKGIDGLY